MKPLALLSVSLAFSSVAVAGVALAGPAPSNGIRPIVSEAELGRLLFWDPILSGERDVACATCHHPDFAYADGRDLPLGAGSEGLGPARLDLTEGEIPPVRRNSPTILNTAFNGLGNGRPGGRRARGGRGDGAGGGGVDPLRAPMFWDSRVRSLETQALEPIRAFDEMRGRAYADSVAVDSVVARLRGVPEYVDLFASVYGGGSPITSAQLAGAIAAFERTLVAMNSPFDRYRAGDLSAMSPEQLDGMEAYEDAGCDQCHGDEGMFSDFALRTLGVAENSLVSQPDVGAGRFRFRTPSLRNVTLTAPYMHNGVLKTLEDVLDFYDEGASKNPAVATNRDRAAGAGLPVVDNDFRRVDDMTDTEMDAIIAFLGALTDPDYDRTVPARVPSGLSPGGALTRR